MKTPEQIRDMEFQKSAMGGYKQSDVELFLEEVASQIEILMKQKAEAERKLQEISKNAPEAALSTASIQSVLVNAQRVAEQAIADANATAEGIVADANIKLAEADIKAREIIAEAESKAVLLGETAENEAAKIIAGAVVEAENIVAEAKESVELEQKLYDRMKIEIADFRKKAAAQCGALVELINQLPGEIPFNLERSKTVLSVDFSDPAELLRVAVDERLAKEKAEAEARAAAEAALNSAVIVTPTVEETSEPSITVAVEEAPAQEVEEFSVTDEPVVEAVAETETETVDSMQMTFDNEEPIKFTFEDDGDDDEEEDEADVTFSVAISATSETPKAKSRISFGEDDDDEDEEDDEEEFDDDDDDDDEPRLFFRRKKK